MNTETKALLAQAHRSLAAARRDVSANDPDNAISRAYYATFHAASAALHEDNLSARSHKGTHAVFYREYIATRRVDKKCGQILSHLFQSRLDADYVSGATFSLDDATDALRQAKAFVSAVERVLG